MEIYKGIPPRPLVGSTGMLAFSVFISQIFMVLCWSISDPQLLFFFRQLATDKPMAEIQALCLCQWANVLVCCRLYGSVYLVQHGKQQAPLTLHQVVCAITALDFLKSFPPYPIRIRTIGKVRAMEADFQGVPFSSFISHRQHPLRMGLPRQLRPLQSPLPTHLRHRVLYPPHR